MRLVLYQRDNCPLCDEAFAQLALAKAGEFTCIWIDGDETLEERFGSRVPVLRDEESNRDLDWPFSGNRMASFFRGTPPSTDGS